MDNGSCLDGVDNIKRADETASSNHIAKEEGGEVDEEKELGMDGEVRVQRAQGYSAVYSRKIMLTQAIKVKDTCLGTSIF